MGQAIAGLIGGAYEGQSRVVSAQKAVNVFIELGDGVASLQGVPGTDLVADLTYPIRGMINAWGRLYVVAGATVYQISSTGTALTLGTITNDGSPVSLTNNIFELLIISAGNGWVVQKAGGALTAITDTDMPSTAKADFLDGYGMLLEKNSGRFHFTTINDFETISGIDFATAEGAPDDLVSLIVDHRELWLFGELTTEVWFNSGDAINPFQRQTILERGCTGTFSPAKLDNTVFWLGENGVIYRADGFTPIRVSNYGIEYQIAQTTVDPIGFAYTWNGHDFYHLNFPGELTIVYDASIPDPNKAWHTRETRDRKDCVYHYHASAFGNEYVGGDKLYKLNQDTYQHNGDELARIRAFGPLRTDVYQTMPSLTLLFETGENSDPLDVSKLFLEISEDGGRTYGNRIEVSVGTQGQYTTEVKFLALGGFYDGERVLKLTMTDNAQFALVDARVA